MEERYQVLLKFNAHYMTESVAVVGDFTGWNKDKIYLEKTDDGNIWKTYMELPSGEYAYHFLTDGDCFHLDPYNPLQVNREGKSYSKLVVGLAQIKKDALHDDCDIDVFSANTVYLKIMLNKNIYKNSKLIIMIDDVTQSVPGYILYNDFIYSHYMFKFQKGLKNDGIFYYFEIEKTEGGTVYYGRNGIVDLEWEVENFDYKQWNTPPLLTPEWAKKAVFYQIFPDSFNKSGTGLPPVSNAFYGGNLEGIFKKIEYLKELKITAIYFNPLFEAPSPHKYDTSDYRQIDKHFGTDENFSSLVKLLDENSIRFILDGVFNHTGTGFFAFKDLEEKGEASVYKDWYFIKKFPLLENGKPNYQCWWNFPSLPKLNVQNEDVKAYLFETAGYWLSRGASGWRLDVPNEIHHSFWKKFREAMKSGYPDSFLIGEIWHNGRAWLRGDEFDSIMNYSFRDACVEFFARKKMSAENFVIELGKLLEDYPMQSNFVLLNLLSSHDTPRFYTLAGRDINSLKLAAAFQFTYLGIPMIYYGEEIGMEGGKDPDNRRPMEWDKVKWNMDIYSLYSMLIRIRRENPVLSEGDIRFFYARDGIIGFERFTPSDRLSIFINNSGGNFQIDLTMILGNGDFVDISKDHTLKRKKVFTLYDNDFVILRKVKDR